ncbi:MAG: enoyl-CoA hydratase/isomerase family protein, partial [Pseudomonadota bacterium]|nr:enoyl-CoA hydratase/isomerase family protein [Pseudomonadota bacterium]
MTRVMKRGGVTTITLNRPQQRNALNEDVIRRLADATAEAAADPDCRCLVVKGQGDHFCAGRDLGEADKSMPLGQVMEYDQLWADVIGSIRTMGAPSVAVVRGFAVAGGFTLSMACDFVLAERSARFGALEMKGGFPAAVNTAVLSHLVGPR